MPPIDRLIQAAGQFMGRGQRDQARAALAQALTLDPAHPLANQYMGLLLAQASEFDPAIAHLEVAARAMPRDAGLQCNLGMLKSSRGRMEEAETHFRAAIAMDPRSVDALTCLGLLLSNRQRAAESEEILRRAAALAPQRTDITLGLSRLLTETGRAEDSVSLLRAAVRASPADAVLQDKLCMMLNYVQGISDENLFAEHIRYGQVAPHPDGDFSRVNRDPGRRLRIGYLSADLREHAVTYFLEPLLERHDRARFETVCYAVGAADDATPRFRSKADHWRALFPASDDAILSAIRADHVDILVELGGHTGSNRLGVVARRAAPVQATYIGYPNTTGLPAVDYRIIDSITDPPGADAVATERLIRLDPCFLCYRPFEHAPDVTPLPCATGSTFTFGSFNNLAKLTPDTAALWARVLHAVPGSRLLLKGKALADPSIAAIHHDRFASHGIGPDRLGFLPHTPSTREHLAAYASVDLALDPFPYSGTTTTCEAMWMGVPVVTIAGRRHSARVGMSLLSAVGLTEFIAPDADAYIRTAAAFAADRARLSELRATLRARLRSSPLCDAAAFVPKLELAYRQMWRRWCGAGPDA
jgi:protein O-GlcNAc transferase